MKLKNDVKPITYLKNHTADLVREVRESGGTVVITQNGSARAVVMGVETYDRWRQVLALLKILSHAEADRERGRVGTTAEAIRRARAAIAEVRRRG